jgi:glycosyltransferase involved in cell wall biosynthesis
MQRDGVCLYHGLTGELPRGLKAAGIRSVVTIHDLIFLRHPEYYHWLDTKIYAWKFRNACREADCIIAISERTKQDVMELGGVSEDRIRVIYQSCAPKFRDLLQEEALQQVRRKYGLPQRFLLSVGTIEERKNLALAVHALASLSSDIHLVAVGDRPVMPGSCLRVPESICSQE